MSKFRVGIIGAGGIVRQRHAPGIAAIADVEIAAIANSTTDSARDFAQAFAPAAQVFSDWRGLIGAVDVVWIGAGPFLHAPATIEALQQKRPVFCQARMATDLASANKMLVASEASPELLTMLCPPPHGLEADKTMQRLLAEGVTGPIQKVILESRSGSFLDSTAPLHWRQDPEISGKNILTLGIHTEVLQRWFGKFEIISASSRTLTRERKGRPVLIPDELSLTVQFRNGFDGDLLFSGISQDQQESLEIVGRDATLRIDYMPDRISLTKEGRRSEIPLPPDEVRPWRVEADFFDALREPASDRPHPTFRDGVAYMEIVDRVWDFL